MLTLGRNNRLDQQHPPLPSRPCQCPEWALGESEASLVKKEQYFKTLLADSDINIKLMYLRSRIGVTMEVLAESLPCYNGKDFLVVHKNNNKGI